MDCSLPSSSVHGILQARILEWVAIPFFSGSSPARDRTLVSYIAGRFFTVWTTREPLELQGSTYMQVFFSHWLVLQYDTINNQLNLKMKNHSPEWRTDCKVIHWFSTMCRGSVPLILTLFKSQLYFPRKKKYCKQYNLVVHEQVQFCHFPHPIPHSKTWYCWGFFACHSYKLLLESSGWRLESSLNILQCTGQPSTTKNYLTTNIISGWGWETLP